MNMFCIYGPNGNALTHTISPSRKLARKMFPAESGTKWGHLWELGYRCRALINHRGFK